MFIRLYGDFLFTFHSLVLYNTVRFVIILFFCTQCTIQICIRLITQLRSALKLYFTWLFIFRKEELVLRRKCWQKRYAFCLFVDFFGSNTVWLFDTHSLYFMKLCNRDREVIHFYMYTIIVQCTLYNIIHVYKRGPESLCTILRLYFYETILM